MKLQTLKKEKTITETWMEWNNTANIDMDFIRIERALQERALQGQSKDWSKWRFYVRSISTSSNQLRSCKGEGENRSKRRVVVTVMKNQRILAEQLAEISEGATIEMVNLRRNIRSAH